MDYEFVVRRSSGIELAGDPGINELPKYVSQTVGAIDHDHEALIEIALTDKAVIRDVDPHVVVVVRMLSTIASKPVWLTIDDAKRAETGLVAVNKIATSVGRVVIHMVIGTRDKRKPEYKVPNTVTRQINPAQLKVSPAVPIPE